MINFKALYLVLISVSMVVGRTTVKLKRMQRAPGADFITLTDSSGIQTYQHKDSIDLGEKAIYITDAVPTDHFEYAAAIDTVGVDSFYVNNNGSWILFQPDEQTDSLFSNVDYSRVRYFAGFPRPTVSGSTISWTLINDADHVPVFTGAITASGSALEVFFASTVDKILSVGVTTDEALAQYAVVPGVSIGLDKVTIRASQSYIKTFQLITHDGATWSNTLFNFATISQSGTTTTVNTPDLGINANFSFNNIMPIYAGTNDRIVRIVSAGLGYHESKFQLIDGATRTAVAPINGDRVLLQNPYNSTVLNMQVADSYGLEKLIFGGAQTNFILSGFVVLN